MSKTFDELQALQRELNARQSDSVPLGNLSPEKEVPPMGSEHGGYPPLDRMLLRDGYKLCVGNAKRLIADAKLLMGAGRSHTAYLILSLAQEELGNAIQLYEAGCSGVGDWKAWWHRYFSHPKKLESTVLDIPSMATADQRFNLARNELVYVDFDREQRTFVAPPVDDDRQLLELTKTEAAHVEDVLAALPPHAFERWEFEDMVQDSPELLPGVLYARIEELLGEEPVLEERDLLTAIARDLGRPPDKFAAGYQRWKNAAPKTRVYLDVLRRVQDKLRKGGTEGAESFKVSPHTGSKASEAHELGSQRWSPPEESLKQTTNTVNAENEAYLTGKHRTGAEGLEGFGSTVDGPAEYETASPPAFVERPTWTDETVQESTSLVGDAETLLSQDEAQQGLPVKPETARIGNESTAPERKIHGLVHVRYQNTRAGQVDDVTLEELIGSKRISHFFRPSEDKWVDISTEPVREGARGNTTGPWRRASDWELKREEEQKRRGFFRNLFTSPDEPAVAKKQLGAREWFEQGFVALHTTGDCDGAARAFAMCIQLDPTYERAYVNRALAYERLGNTQQAVEDYSRAILVDPHDAKVYYLRGLAYKQLGMTEEAIRDFQKAAEMRFRPASDLLKSLGISS
ncbi:MAG: Tetratricopeptide 2 repeat protein [Deltaproteobacteria bacterium]|nr:Tetratricopeptide 2 repeat protein [Deltaproteobacteria bacterium]